MRKLSAYLDCGLLCHGFARLRCVECGYERLVAFSRKGKLVGPKYRDEVQARRESGVRWLSRAGFRSSGGLLDPTRGGEGGSKA